MEGGDYRLKNYYWPLAISRAKLPNGQPLSKVVGPLGRPSEKYVYSQNHTEICYETAVFQYCDIVISIVDGKCFSWPTKLQSVWSFGQLSKIIICTSGIIGHCEQSTTSLWSQITVPSLQAGCPLIVAFKEFKL